MLSDGSISQESQNSSTSNRGNIDTMDADAQIRDHEKPYEYGRRLYQAYQIRQELRADESGASQNSEVSGMDRRIGNIGVFAELPERMSKKHIREIAKEFDISLKGVTILIDMDEDKIRLPQTGRADTQTIGRIDFFPNAFISKEELLRTLYHEQIHVQQFREYAAENDFIEKLKEEGKL